MKNGKAKQARLKGNQAEDAAAAYFTARHYAVLARNYKVPGLGELDLVLEQDGQICVVEVKARSDRPYGDAAECLTAGQMKRLRSTTLHFLQTQGLMHKCVSFLAAIVKLDQNGKIMNIITTPFE